MINPNVVGIPLPDSATRVPVTGGGQSGPPAPSNVFTEVMTSAEVYQGGCHGTMNEVNLDDFFAAWGSNDSAYDIDNNGTVDGQDLSMFLGMGQPAGPPAPGSAEDIQSQWGTVGHSTADLNADYIVDGLDLALSLGDSAPDGGLTFNQPAEQSESPLQSILDNWGSAEQSSDLDADGTTSGSDLAMLLSGLSGLTQSDVEPMDVSPVSQQVFDILNEMGFAEQAPVNINQVIDGLRLGTFESKSVTMDLLELYGKSSKSDARQVGVSRR